MSSFFSNRFKTPIHVVQLCMAVAVLILALVRMFTKTPGMPTGRSGTMAIGMAAKSIVLMLYQILTEHVNSLKKWSSLKAYFIINAMEIVFWAAVAFMSIQSNSRFCQGITCTVSWIVVVLAIIIAILAAFMTGVTWFDWRHFRAYGTHRGRDGAVKGTSLEDFSSENIVMGEVADGQRKYDRGH